MKPFIRSANNYDTHAASLSHAKRPAGEMITDQSGKDDADINVLVRRFGVTALASDVPMPPALADFSTQVFDFHSSMNQIRAAEESFAALPAAVRSRFSNDPHLFVNFCSEVTEDGTLANLDEMRKFGLAVPPKPATIPPDPTRVVVVNPEVEDGGSTGRVAPKGAGKGSQTKGGAGEGS